MLGIFGTIIVGSIAVAAAGLALAFVVASGKCIYETLKK